MLTTVGAEHNVARGDIVHEPGPHLIEQAVLETNRLPTGNRSQTSAPADVFRTEDGWIVCQVPGPSQFGRWAILAGLGYGEAEIAELRRKKVV